MASAYGKKKGFFSKLGNAFKKAVVGTAAVGALVGVPGYYNYGTIQTQIVTPSNVYSKGEWNQDANKLDYMYMVDSDKGHFRNEKSKLHLKSEEDAEGLYRLMTAGKTYEVTSYGFNVLGMSPNILSAREMNRFEVEKYQKEQAAKNGITMQQKQPGVNDITASTGTTPLSGRVTTLDVVSADGNNTVQLTMPVEVAGKITVNGVTPLQQQPSAPAPATPPAPKL